MAGRVTIEIADRLATVTIDNPPVNAASHDVRAGLMAALKRTETEKDVRAVVLVCAGRTFVAGADVREFGQPPQDPLLPEVVSAIEAASKPWVAAIHGTALGGGLELAMGCHYRIASVDAKLGTPEVNLGLIPGAGGTVRLPRLAGPLAALEMIAGGRPLPAAKAREFGLVDEIAEGNLVQFARAFAAGLDPAAPPPRTLGRPVEAPAAEPWHAAEDAVRRKARGQKAPLAAIAAIRRAVEEDPEAALAAERETFLELKDSAQSAALRHIFFAERAASRMARIEDATPRPLAHIGIVGGGTMGAGIAAACLLAGFDVTLIERDAQSLEGGVERIGAILDGSLKRGVIGAADRKAMGDALMAATDYRALQEADLIVEAVFEDMATKRHVFERLDRVAKPGAILATNTSYLDVAELAAGTTDPSRVLGLHFFSPAHIMKLLEVVHHPRLADDALATGFALAKRLGKIAVPSGVCDGFIGNRVMSAYRREVDYLVEDGALPWQVDAAMRDFGFPLGIYEMQDMAGLDISWAMRKRKAATRPPGERYVKIADRICEMGRLGRKTGAGWYRYEDGKALPDLQVEALILDESRRKGIVRKSMTGDDIMARILEVMQAEARVILREGIAERPGDIDVVMVNGYGFPRWHGGPMWMADNG